MQNNQVNRERRRKGRIRCENVLCNLGSVIDISAWGVRLRRSGLGRFRPGRELKLRIMASDGILDLRGKVVWSKSLGFCQQAFGVEFVNLTPHQESLLVTIGRSNRRLHAA